MAESTMGQLKAVCQSTKTDTIYRQAAIDAVIKCDANCGIDSAEVLRALPSAERKGHYIGTQYDGYADGCPVYDEWVCSECGCVFEDEEPTYKYCPNCGAKMGAEE